MLGLNKLSWQLKWLLRLAGTRELDCDPLTQLDTSSLCMGEMAPHGD